MWVMTVVAMGVRGTANSGWGTHSIRTFSFLLFLMGDPYEHSEIVKQKKKKKNRVKTKEKERQ